MAVNGTAFISRFLSKPLHNLCLPFPCSYTAGGVSRAGQQPAWQGGQGARLSGALGSKQPGIEPAIFWVARQLLYLLCGNLLGCQRTALPPEPLQPKKSLSGSLIFSIFRWICVAIRRSLWRASQYAFSFVARLHCLKFDSSRIYCHKSLSWHHSTSTLICAVWQNGDRGGWWLWCPMIQTCAYIMVVLWFVGFKCQNTKIQNGASSHT